MERLNTRIAFDLYRLAVGVGVGGGGGTEGPTETTIAPSGNTIPGRSSPDGVPSAFNVTGREGND